MIAASGAYVAPAQAAGAQATEWESLGTYTFTTPLLELSGVAMGDKGTIYAVDDDLETIFCLTRQGWGGEWRAVEVDTSKAELDGKDIEGMTRRGTSGNTFVISWEDDEYDGVDTNFSGTTEVTIDSLIARNPVHTSLEPIDVGLGNAAVFTGGAAGIAHRGGDEFWVAQEGVAPTFTGVLHSVDLSADSPVGEGIPLAVGTTVGIAIDPQIGPDRPLVLSRGEAEISFVEPITGAFFGTFDTALDEASGLTFTPDGEHLIVIGESSSMEIFARKGTTSRAPRGNCPRKFFNTACIPPISPFVKCPNPNLVGIR